MICPKCGGNIMPQDDGLLVCQGCGAKFVKKAQQNTPSDEGANQNPRVEDVQNLKMRIAQMEQKQAELESELAKTKRASLQNGALGAGKSGFTATVFELFAEKLLLLWVSLVTLGIAYPWLKCHYEGFIASKTYVKGHRLSFDGKGKDLAKKYFVWMLLSVVTFGVYSIFVADKMHKWVIEHTHYDANCGGQSSYNGKVGAIFRYKVTLFFAGLFTLGIAKPFVECKRENYLCEHTLIDGSQLRFDGSGGELMKKQVLWVALTIATFGVYAIWLNLQKQQWICACLSNDDIDFSVDENVGFYDEESAKLAEEKRQQQEQERQKQEQERQQRLLEKQRKKQQLSEMRKSPKGKTSSALFALSVICFAGAFCIMAPMLAFDDWVSSSAKAMVAALIVLSCAAVAMLAGCIACSAKIKRRALAIVSIVLIVLSVGTMSSGIFGVTQIEKYKTTDPFFYTLQDDGTYKVSLDAPSEYDGNMVKSKAENINKLEGNLVIPSSHDGIPVTAIGRFTFGRSYVVLAEERHVNDFKNKITSITIPDTIKTIDERAFDGFNNITEITIPAGVTSIGEGAFNGCSSLESITIPFVGEKAGVTNSDNRRYPFGYIFGTDSYTGGVTIEQINYDYGTENVTYCIPSSLETVTVTGGNILPGAFINCDWLTSITISGGVTSIGNGAFWNCSGLTSIVIPDSVTSIGTYAFIGCTGLTSIIIPDSVTSIGEGAFADCTGLTSIVIPDSVTSIGEGAFSGCTSLESITIPFVGAKAGVTSSDTYQYPFGYIFGTYSYTGGVETEQYYYGSSTSSTTYNRYCIPSSLKSVTVTGGNILYGAFYNCAGLESITIGDGVTSIGEGAFNGCTGLTSIVIPDSVTSIGEGAFSGCTSLESITIPFVGPKEEITESDTIYPFGYIFGTNNYTGGVATEQSNFDSAGGDESTIYYIPSSLKSVTLTGGNMIYGAGNMLFYAFINCSGLESITIPDSVTAIATAFYGCSGLKSIIIPDSVKSIGSKEFDGCTGLERITIGKGVTSIAEGAFSTCTALSRISVAEGNAKYHSKNNCVIETESKTLVLGCKGSSIIPLDGSVTSIGAKAFAGCTGLEVIAIPESVTSIGDGAFDGCTALAGVAYTGTREQWEKISIGANNEWFEKAEVIFTNEML